MSEPGIQELRDDLAEKEILQFTEQELIEAGFKGDGVPESVTAMIEDIKAKPNLLGFMTGFMLFCKKDEALQATAVSPAPVSPTSSESSDWSQVTLSSDSALTLVGDDLVTEFEKYNYYIGICANDDDVPLLFYRTSLQKTPFPAPTPGTRFFQVANKTVQGPFDKVLTRNLWNNIVGPAIIQQALDQDGIKYASLKAVRFSSCDEDGNTVLGPLVIWIGTHAGTTTPERARVTSLAVLRVLTNHGVIGAEVEWYESRVGHFKGPPLMDVVHDTDPTYNYRRPYTAMLSLPVAAKARVADDAQW